MFLLKVKHRGIWKRLRLHTLQWSEFEEAIRLALNLPSMSEYSIICIEPIQSCVINGQTELDLISTAASQGRVILEVKYCEESLFSQILRNLLEMPSNRAYIIQKFGETLKDFPDTSFQTIVPNRLEESLIASVRDLFQEASKISNRESSGQRFVYVFENGKQVLKAVPHTEFIDYSTTCIEDLTKSLPPSVMMRLNESRRFEDSLSRC